MVMPALKLKNASTGRTVGVTERRYAQLIARPEWEDDGSTALFGAMPLPPDFPKQEELKAQGLATVGEVAAVPEGGLADLDDIGKTSEKKIRKVIDRGSLESS